MKIAIDLARLSLGPAGGIAPYLQNLWNTFMRFFPEHEFLVLCTPANRRMLNHGPCDRVQFHPLSAVDYVHQVDRLACEFQADVLFRSYPEAGPCAFPLRRQIFLIPDIQHEFFPEFFSADSLRARRLAFTQALSSAGAIATLSEHSRHTLRQQSCTHCQDIFLASPALPAVPDATPLSPREQAFLPRGDYFFFPANLWPHKNHTRLFQALGRFVEKTPRPCALVCTGHPDGWAKLIEPFASLPIQHLGFVSRALLQQLYRGACALTFFSRFEGFGIPLLEAFAAGVPVLCSNTTSLPEIGGDAVLSCDPEDVEAMAQSMLRIRRDPTLRDEVVRRGRERLRFFTWEQAARNLEAACRRVAGCGHPAWIVREPPLVSIVTPSFNQGHFLKRTIESVLTQDYPHIEYIVVDGRSTDGSLDILKSYGSRFVWTSEPDGGQSHALNKGFARAGGSVRAYLNSDDVLLPGAVGAAVDYFTRHPDWDLLYGNAHYIDEDDRVTGRYNTAAFTFARLLEDCCICQPAAFWRARLAERVGPFNEDLYSIMDYDYWMRADRAGCRLEFVPDYLACARMHAGTKTASARLRTFQEIFRTCMDHAGYVGYGYYLGYWHHRCCERRTGWPARLRGLPGFMVNMAKLHYKWDHAGRSLPRLGKVLLRALARRVVRPVKRRFFASAPFNAEAACGRRHDNWLASRCRFAAPKGGEHVWLRGVPVKDMMVTIRQGMELVTSASLHANMPHVVHGRVRVESRHDVEVEFSDHARALDGREVAFRLEETNLLP